MKAYTYNDRLVGVGNDQILGTDQGGGSTYTAGNGIDITNDVISVDNTVALKTDIPVVTGFATKIELDAVETEVQAVSGMIHEEEEVEFEELDITQFAQASAIPDTSDMATKTWVNNQGFLTTIPSTYATDVEVYNAVVTGVQAATGVIPDVSDMATKTWVGNQGYLIPYIHRATAYNYGSALYNGTGVTIGNTSAKIKLNLSNILTSYTVSDWSVMSSRLDAGGYWEIRVSAILRDVIGSQWTYASNAVTVTSGSIASGPHLFPCYTEWGANHAIQIVTGNTWTQSMDAIVRDVRNDSTVDNNALYINFTIYWYNS